MEISEKLKILFKREEIKEYLNTNQGDKIVHMIPLTKIPEFGKLIRISGLNPLNYLDYIPTEYYYRDLSLQGIYTIPSHIKEIGHYSFAHCSNLEEVHIPYGVETISRGAFLDCKNLHKVTLPLSVRSIEEEVFGLCSNLTIEYEGDKENWENIYGYHNVRGFIILKGR